MTIEQLNAAFAIEGQVQFVEGKGGFPIINIKNAYAEATVSVYAGQILSFKPNHTEHDVLFVSDNAHFQSGKAIKGGTPICWPWFGPDPEGLGRPSHGFVRNRSWTILNIATLDSGETHIVLGVSDTDDTRALYAHRFQLRIEMVIGKTLTLSLITENQSNSAMPITQALHTYFTVGDITKTVVEGLEGTQYLDKTSTKENIVTQQGEVSVDAEVDRIYLDTPTTLAIRDDQLNRRIRITSSGSNSTVVWNPWKVISMQMADLTDEAYQSFICVETTNAASDVVNIPAGESHTLQAVYTVETM